MFVVADTMIAGEDEHPAHGLIVECRAGRNRQDAGAGVADAGVRVAAIQIDLSKCSRRRATAAKLQRPPPSSPNSNS